MIRILHIDTAGWFCSVALSENGNLSAIRETDEKNAHSRVITIFVDEVLKKAGLEQCELDAIAVGMGPGSYTGLRIGVSAAKGLCYALDKPLIGIPTLQAMAMGALELMGNDFSDRQNLIICPMIDARRMEVYSAHFNEKGEEIRDTKAEILDENSYKELLEDHTVIFSGDGSLKFEKMVSGHPNAVFLKDFTPSAKYMIPVALKRFKKNQFEDVAYSEPFYLKDFVAGLPKVKGLR